MKKKGESALTDLFAAAISTAVVTASQTLIAAFSFMLMIGVVHGSWLPDVPTIGFGTSILLAGLATAILTSWRVMIDYKGLVHELTKEP